MKKKIISALLIGCFGVLPAFAQDRTLNGIKENEQLGMMAGLALACNAGARLDDYELIAGRIISNEAQTDADEKKAIKEYAESKFNAYQEQKQTPQATCGEVLQSFERLPIFKSVVYVDGTVKLPDGKILKPRKGAKVPDLKKQAAAKKVSRTTEQQKKTSVTSQPRTSRKTKTQ